MADTPKTEVLENPHILCILGLGSNQPYKGLSSVEIINSAAGDLKKILSDFRLSPLYKTNPLHVTDQETFVNAAASGFFSIIDPKSKPLHADLAARKLLGFIQKIEAQYGRNRAGERRWGERTLDIDILLFGEELIAENDLVIPHQRLKERAFALRPLLDLLPDAAEPGSGLKYQKILESLPIQGISLI